MLNLSSRASNLTAGQSIRVLAATAQLAQLDGRTITRSRSTAVRFSVTYRDDDGVKQSTIDSNDIRVSGPFNGASSTRSAALESVESLGGGRYRATYKITSPGGWDASDNGVYSVKLNTGQISDINGSFAPAGTLGSFKIRIA